MPQAQYQSKNLNHLGLVAAMCRELNNNRLHSYLDYMSPVDFEKQKLKKAA